VDAYLTGTIYADAGQIGGWWITDSSLHNGTDRANTNEIATVILHAGSNRSSGIWATKG